MKFTRRYGVTWSAAKCREHDIVLERVEIKRRLRRVGIPIPAKAIEDLAALRKMARKHRRLLRPNDKLSHDGSAERK